MLEFSRLLQAVDSHTAGEPTRIVTGGLPRIDGATMRDKRAVLQREHDQLRRALVLEPRGHDAIVVAFLLPPCDPAADLGVVFANDAGYLGMCGHGSIGVVTVAIAMGLVAAREGRTEVRLDTPVGTVTCVAAVERGRARSVAITNVPSFRSHERAIVPVAGYGKVAAAVAYGGNWFAFVDAAQLGLAVERARLPELTQAAMAVRQGLLDAGIRGVDPVSGAEQVVDHVKLYAPLEGADGPAAKAFTLCPGVAYDRSPCGTGTSAKLAVLHAEGKLRVGEWFTSASVLGTRFGARIVAETEVAGRPAVVPEIVGSAWITALPTFVLDPDDPLLHGF